MKKFTAVLLFALISLLSAGCGYKFGSLSHPQLESIAVAPVANDTLSFNASAVLRGMLTERITTDGSLKLKSRSKADCILYARISSVNYTSLGYGTSPLGEDTFLPDEWRCSVTVEYSVIIPGRGKPLIASRTITGKSDFVAGPDLETSRLNGMRQAAFEAAKAIVSGIVENW